MKCAVDGCESEATYKGLCLCQKHYFRQYRNGTINLTRKAAKPRITMPGRGYQLVHDPKHPLAHKNGYVFEHRKIVFDLIGFSLCKCEICGAPESWETVHIDHIDNNPKNNAPENLRPLCRACNTRRDYPEAHTSKANHAVCIGQVTLTAAEWGRLTGGFLSGSAIARRISSGMSHEAALMTEKSTHGKGQKPPYTREGLEEIARHYREEARKMNK
jgi:5-methylcytosine-specific restriction endonuclease McrA